MYIFGKVPSSEKLKETKKKKLKLNSQNTNICLLFTNPYSINSDKRKLKETFFY